MTFDEFRNGLKHHMIVLFPDISVRYRLLCDERQYVENGMVEIQNGDCTHMYNTNHLYASLLEEDVSIDELAKRLYSDLRHDESYIHLIKTGNIYEDVCSFVFPKLVNIRSERDRLSELVFHHIPHTDLLITYYVSCKEQSDIDATVIVTQKMIDQWGVEETLIRQDAFKNLRECDPMSVRLLPIMVDVPEEQQPLIVTSKSGFNGAIYVFMPGIIEYLNNLLGQNIIIAPASVNSCLVALGSSRYARDYITNWQEDLEENYPEIFLTKRIYTIGGRK